ncbi:MAG TPA: xylose isomerase [Desulfobacterales bacterium]|nr:xylose isomerase [Desulfobacterales bacterium]
MANQYKFSFGPWNIHCGADPFGPVVRDELSFDEKLTFYRKLGFEGVQFHDDDAVPDLNELTPQQVANRAKAVKKQLEDHGLEAEFVAPRLWEDPRTIDGAYTANDPQHREYALERSRRTIDIANALETDLVVLWLAREGTYIRESKDSKKAVDLLVQAINAMLDYEPHMRFAIEPKPNEPMDQAFIPTTGHAIGLAYLCNDPSRVGVNIESAHAILAGLDPSDEMGYALAHNKLWTVHLNDQNGLKFDEDKTFGSVDIRRAFNQVRILETYNYGQNGEYVGLDVKAMRTQKSGVSSKHLINSRRIFLRLVDLVRSLDEQHTQDLIKQRDYEELDFVILNHLMGG